MLKNLSLGERALTVAINGGDATSFDYFWLRDNARDPHSFDSRSHQRELFTAAVDPDIRPVSAHLAGDGGALVLDWPDLDGLVQYDAAFLDEFSMINDSIAMPVARGWDHASLDQQEVRVAYGEITGDQGIKPLMERVLTHGFAVVTGTPRNLDAVERVTNVIGYVRHSIFGGLFEFEANQDMADSAYTPKELRPHTDGTYSHDAPGLQLLLCVDYDATGGESIMVDGARIAEQLKATSPKVYDDLTRIGVTGIYKGDGAILRARRPIFRTDADGHLVQVTFNNYDRDTVRMHDDDMRALYDGIRQFDQIANDPAFQWRYTLTPGDMLVFDNWRVLHGRGAFAGRRKMAGAYLNHEDFESRVRSCGLV
jgi:trimethyllysine dioxygenase